MTHDQIKKSLQAAELSPDEIFALTRAIAYFFQSPDTESVDSLDLIIRLLDRRQYFESRLRGVGAMIDAIAREAGLYPYIEGQGKWHDELAINLMQAPGLENIVFHIEQALIFNKLARGRSIILSAPTSFGKSLLIDALIAHRQPNVVVAVVPTIALLDEFRRRMSKRFPNYQIISTASEQRTRKKNIFVGTQERLLEREDIGEIDLFVIDEFYKLDLEQSDNRSLALNAALAKFGTRAKQIYFLGPSIDDVPNARKFRPDLEFIKTRYSPVTADIIDRTEEKPTPQRLIDDLRSVRGENSLIYVRSPKATWTMAYELVGHSLSKRSSFCEDLGEWLEDHFHPEWVLAESVKDGIGIHHGRVPRAIAHLVISLFNKSELGTIICTSSMIEGVNTAAENVFIYDRHISTQKLDRFTFDNIKGRAGRMFRHKIGKIFLYNNPPEQSRYDVRVPLFETDDLILPELLLQLDDESLTSFARQRKRAITEASILPAEILKKWAEYGVEELNILADHLADNLENPDSALYWKGFPTYNQLTSSFEAVWGRLDFPKHDMRTPKQASYFALTLQSSGAIRPFMDRLVRGTRLGAQKDVDLCFNFLRGSEYTFPQILRALNDVIDAIIGPGSIDYRVFASNLQNLFLAPGLRVLDEYGVPIPLVQKLDLLESEDIQSNLRLLQQRDSPSRNKLSSLEQDLLSRGMSLE